MKTPMIVPEYFCSRPVDSPTQNTGWRGAPSTWIVVENQKDDDDVAACSKSSSTRLLSSGS
jgi:hypothetical protein